METQNITLSLPKNTLQKIKILAVQRHSSVSKLLTQAVEKILREETTYEEARKRQVDLMKQGFDLEFRKPASRDELHER
jgi:metal-responsive CopG/Arc/MetJ family transcriptional regulator